MTIYALPVSDAMAAQLADAPAEQRHAAEQAAIEAIAEALETDVAVTYQPTASEIASLTRGFADADADHVIDGPSCLAELRLELGNTERV